MKSNLAIILAASIGLAACGKKVEDVKMAESVADVAASAPDSSQNIPRIAPSFVLSDPKITDVYQARVYFYNDPNDPTMRCQTVQHIEGVDTSCWKIEPR